MKKRVLISENTVKEISIKNMVERYKQGVNDGTWEWGVNRALSEEKQEQQRKMPLISVEAYEKKIRKEYNSLTKILGE